MTTSTLCLTLDILIPLAFFLVGLPLLWLSHRKHRRKSAPVCFSCGYDMRVSPGLTCPECGFTHPTQHRLLHGKRRPYLAIFAFLLLMISLIPPVVCALQHTRAWLIQRDIRAFETAYPNYVNKPPTTPYDHPLSINYSWLTRQVAFHQKRNLHNQSIHDELFSRRPTQPDRQFLTFYLSSLFFSPLQHYGRSATLRGYYSINTHIGSDAPNLTQTQADDLLCLAAKSPLLRYITLSPQVPVTDRAIRALERRPSLESINIANSVASSLTLARLSRLPEIKSIFITTQTPLDDDAVHALLSTPNLTTLSLKAPGSLTAACLQNTGRAKLHWLELDIPLDVPPTPDFLSRIPQVTYFLRLKLPTIDGPTLRSFERLDVQNLKLDFTDNPHLHDADLEWIAKIPYLCMLQITAGKNNTGRAIRHLASNLPPKPVPAPLHIYGASSSGGWFLELRNFTFDDPDLAALSKIHGTIVLRNCRFTHPTTLQPLTQSPNLTALCFYQTPLTDNQWRTVASMPSLQSLNTETLTDHLLKLISQNNPNNLTLWTANDQTTPAAKSRAKNIQIRPVQNAQ